MKSHASSLEFSYERAESSHFPHDLSCRKQAFAVVVIFAHIFIEPTTLYGNIIFFPIKNQECHDINNFINYFCLFNCKIKIWKVRRKNSVRYPCGKCIYQTGLQHLPSVRALTGQLVWHLYHRKNCFKRKKYPTNVNFYVK